MKIERIRYTIILNQKMVVTWSAHLIVNKPGQTKKKAISAAEEQRSF